MFASMLALALVVSVGSTPVFANQSSPSQENPKDIIWVDGSKQYDENGKLLPTPTSDGKGTIQPYAGTTYRIKNQTFLGSTIKLDSYITASWQKTSYYKLSRSHTGKLSTKVEGSSTIKNVVKLVLGADFTYSYSESVGTEIEADKSKFSKLAYFVEYDKYKGDAYRVDYEDDFGTVKETSIGTAKWETPVDSYLDVVYK